MHATRLLPGSEPQATGTERNDETPGPVAASHSRLDGRQRMPPEQTVAIRISGNDAKDEAAGRSRQIPRSRADGEYQPGNAENALEVGLGVWWERRDRALEFVGRLPHV